MRRTLAALAAAAVSVAVGFATAGPAAAAPSLRFHGAQYDSPGSDNRTNASLNNEWISLVNTGAAAVNLNGYTVRDTSNHIYKFGAVTIAARGGRIWLHTGKGTRQGGHVYWGSGAYIWNNTGDTAHLRTAAGSLMDTCAWASQANRTWVAC